MTPTDDLFSSRRQTGRGPIGPQPRVASSIHPAGSRPESVTQANANRPREIVATGVNAPLRELSQAEFQAEDQSFQNYNPENDYSDAAEWNGTVLGT